MTDEVKQMVDEIKKLAHELKSTKENENLKDTLTEQKFDKMADEVTQLSERLQKEEAEKKAVQDRLDAFEAALNRKGLDGGEAEEKVAEHKAAFDNYLRNGVVPEGIKMRDGGLEIRAMSSDSDPDGGYLIMPEMANFIVGRAFETSPIRQVARVVTGSAKSLSALIDDDEAAVAWTAEDGASSDSDTPELGELEIFAHKIDAEPQATVEMLEDAELDLEAWLQSKAADKIARTENTAFVTGNGIGKPRGFMSFSNWASAGVYERNKVEQIASGATATLTADGLISLQNALKEAYQPNASFLMKRGTFGAILKLKGADNYFFSPTLLRDGQSTLQLLGKDVRFADDVAAVSANALSIAYGDFGQGYTIYDRRGIIVIRDALTNKGRVKFYVAKRVGGHVTNFDAIKIQKVAVSV